MLIFFLLSTPVGLPQTPYRCDYATGERW